MLGTFQANSWVALFAATGVILSAAYALYLYRRIVFGVLTKDNLKSILDLNMREAAMLGTLLVLTDLLRLPPVADPRCLRPERRRPGEDA